MGSWKRDYVFYLGLIPVLTVIALLLAFSRSPHATTVFEPPLLLPLLNTVFLFMVGCVVFYAAARSYLLSGLPALILLGCGVLSLGIGALVAGWVREPWGANANVTIFNVSALVSSIFHLWGVIANVAQTQPELNKTRRQQKLVLVMVGVPMLIAVLCILTLGGAIPPFFIQGIGPLPIRQIVVAVSGGFYFICFASLMSRFLEEEASFLYWYALALGLMAINTVGVYMQPAVGSPVGWIGRAAQYAAGLYFVAAVTSAFRSAKQRATKLGTIMAELFQAPGLHWRDIMDTVSDAVISVDEKGSILLWNKAAVGLFGPSRDEALEKNIEAVVPTNKVMEAVAAIEKAGEAAGVTEIDFITPAGASFQGEASISVKRSSLGRIATFIIRDVTERKQAEEALQESEERYRNLFTHLNSAALLAEPVFDGEGRLVDLKYLMANPAVRKHLGKAPEEFVGRLFSEVYYPRTRNPVFDTYEKVLSSGEPYKDEILLPASNRYCDFSVYRPTPGRLALILSDITERKKAEEELRRKQAELQALFDYSNASLALFDAKPPYTVLAHNQYYQKLWAEPFKSKGLVGKDLLDYVPEVEVQGVKAIYDEVVKTGEARNLTDFPYEGISQGKTWWNWHLSPIIQGGKVIAMAHMGIDVTERHLAEEALRESEGRFRALTETSSLAVGVSSLSGEFLYLNKAYENLFGYTLEELRNTNASEIWKDPKGRSGMVDALRKGESLQGYEAEFKRKDGKTFWASLTVNNVDFGGNPAVMATVYDITERKQAEEALRASEQRERERAEEFAALLDAVPTPVIIARNPECTHLMGNRAANELL
ncbi:MAG: PAS domain S-box protein, partial [Smithellaceae bacterium]|nr:PAS domain S-box protein [Smithellaceae bacterium]